MCVVCEWVIECITEAHPEDPNLLLGAGSNNATLTVFDLRSAEPVKQWNVRTCQALALALPGCQTYFLLVPHYGVCVVCRVSCVVCRVSCVVCVACVCTAAPSHGEGRVFCGGRRVWHQGQVGRRLDQRVQDRSCAPLLLFRELYILAHNLATYHVCRVVSCRVVSCRVVCV
jgi:hypothetical protein